MANDWLPIRIDLNDDPAVIAVAAACDLDEFAVCGRLLKLWGWANRNTVDGNAEGNAVGVTESWVDRYLSAPGFARALIAVGWLARTGGDGSPVLCFPKFERWNSQGAKKRALTAQRVSRCKIARKDGANAQGNAVGNAPSVTKSVPKEEKRREEVKAPPSEGEPQPKPPVGAMVKAKSPRPANPVFDAVAAVTGVDRSTAGSLLGAVSAALGKAEPPYTAEDVHEFARRFWELCPWAASDNRTRPTPKELQTHIGRLRAGPAPTQTAPSRGGVNLFDHAAKTEARIMAQCLEAMDAP